ncbi:MAG: AtpZ/AtpI family protein [Gemmatimonadetes bacterium]|nr:AtpZ/AtpI family protein [Gemmatimonadota bacterium]
MPDREGEKPGPTKTRRKTTGPALSVHGQEAAGLGLTMAFSIALFALGGNWLDGRLGTRPLFVLLGVFLGFGLSFYRMYALLVLNQRDGDGD